MRILRGIGRWLWRFMVIFSFVVNLVLIGVVLFLLATLFDIKQNIAEPLVGGLYSAFVGLEDATIDWTIPVRADVPVNLDIPLQQNTVVILTEAVPMTVVANIQAPALSLTNARVTLELPVGLRLPVSLDLNVPVRDSLPVSLDVRAVIPLADTQLEDVAQSLQLLFEPLAVGLVNLPNDYGAAFAMIGDFIGGRAPNLLAPNAFSQRPWPGFSRSAGNDYPTELLLAPVPQANVPVETGIVQMGGIPALDEQIRPEIYAAGGPSAFNDAAVSRALIPSIFYDGSYADFRRAMIEQNLANQPTPTPVNPNDLGILPTPSAPTP
jgi:hypothetical protein